MSQGGVTGIEGWMMAETGRLSFLWRVEKNPVLSWFLNVLLVFEMFLTEPLIYFFGFSL